MPKVDETDRDAAWVQALADAERATAAVRRLATALASRPESDATALIEAVARRDSALRALGAATLAARAPRAVVVQPPLAAGVSTEPVDVVAPEPVDVVATEPVAGVAPEPVDVAATEPFAGVAPEPAMDLAPPPAAARPKPRARPPAPPATAAQLAALKDHLGQGGRSMPKRPTPTADRVARITRALGPPDPLPGPAEARAALAALDEATADLDAWLDLPKPVQRQLLAYVAARARQAQEALGGLDALRPEEAALFHRWSGWSKAHEPGWVLGLALDHVPDLESWAAQAAAAWAPIAPPRPKPVKKAAPFGIADLQRALEDGVDDEALCQIALALIKAPDVDDDHLVQLLVPHIDRLKGHPELKRLRKRIARARDARDAADRAEAETARDGLPPDWAWRAHTVGRRAVMLGGDDRHHARQRIQQHFGFDTLHWETGWDPRKIDALAERVKAGSVDVVLLIRRFVQHKATDAVIPACKEAGVPFVPIGGGYGISAIQAAIEQHLAAAG